jgi:threonine aldolase
MFFASDNWAGAAPEIIDAVSRESSRYGAAYGGSAADDAIRKRFCEIFERDVAVFLVGTGTAANALVLASVSKPGGAVFAHVESHVYDDECGGPNFMAGGIRLLPLPGKHGKFTADALQKALVRFPPDFPHAGQPMAVSVSQMTESGTVYTPDEIAAIARVAKTRNMPVHMDGARFANALVHLGVAPAEMSWKAGIDMLSFGATKNGCLAAEAVIFFDPALAKDTPFIRMRAGQLFSKMRFMAAQFDAYFRDDLWLRMARHANGLADRLREGFGTAPNARLAWPTPGNEVFVVMPTMDAERLRSAGAAFHDWPLPHGFESELREGESLVRFIASFATRDEDVDRLLAEFAAETKTPRQSRGAKSA